MIYGITYDGGNMSKAANLCVDSMIRHGVEKAVIRAPRNLSLEFVENNREILQAERGVGYWLWKPYIIHETMKVLKDDDILIYSDAGVEFVNNVAYIIDRMDQDLFLFTNTHPQFHWCKREAMTAMGDRRNEGGQVQASVIFIKVSPQTRVLIKEWLLWCQMPGLIDDTQWMTQHAEFQDHRHDQAIITNLAYKYDYHLHWWPTAYAEHIRVPGDNYPVLFNHHRKRDNEF